MAKGRAKGWKPAEHGKNPGGRPIEWTEEIVDAIAAKLDQWSKEPDSLFMATFLAENDLYWDLMPTLRERSEFFSEVEKKAKVRLESHVAVAAATGGIDKTLGIFALKQGKDGWTDKQEMKHSGEIATTHRYEIPNTRPIE